MRVAAGVVGVILGTGAAGAQPQSLPPTPLPPATFTPPVPNTLPPGLMPGGPVGRPAGAGPLQPPGLLPSSVQPPTPFGPSAPGGVPGAQPGAMPSGPAELPLPQAERKIPISAMDVQAKRVEGGWEVWAGTRQLRNVGNNEANARDVVRVFRDLHPTEWVTVGGARPVVEYGLTNGRPAVAGAAPAGKADAGAGNGPQTGGGQQTGGGSVQQAGGFGPAVAAASAKFVQAIDLRSARAEPIRGAWCVRDDDNILLNFGPDRAGAEQATAVIRKYGFNRVGVVGPPAQPVMSYLFVSLEQERPKVAGGPLFVNAQIEALTRTGVPVPGAGFVGEMVKIDARKVEARKDGADWVVAAGGEVLGRFGPTEWAAREAARAVRDAHFTEFCKLGGTSNLTFFLRDGKAPARAPFTAQARSFDPGALKVQQVNGKWAVTEGGRPLFDVSGQSEGEVVVRVLKAYGFDQLAHLNAGGGGHGGITFLVKGR